VRKETICGPDAALCFDRYARSAEHGQSLRIKLSARYKDPLCVTIPWAVLVVLTADPTALVPEPKALVLALLGVGGLVLRLPPVRSS